jgi:hypothetical protein
MHEHVTPSLPDWPTCAKSAGWNRPRLCTGVKYTNLACTTYGHTWDKQTMTWAAHTTTQPSHHVAGGMRMTVAFAGGR